MKRVAVLGLICLVSCSAGGAGTSVDVKPDVLKWEGFEDARQTWAVESARGPVELSRTKDLATEGTQSLKLVYDKADRADFEARREVRLDLSRMQRVLLDIYSDQPGVEAAVAFKSGEKEDYFETPKVKLAKGWNRDVSFRLDGSDFNRFKVPLGEPMTARDDVRRVMLVFFRDKDKAGEVLVDDIRLEGLPQEEWQQLVPRIRKIRLSDVMVRRFERVEMDVDFDASFGDVFDPDEIRVSAQMRDPDGKQFEVPGFVYSLGDEKAAQPRPTWKVRFTPTVVGKYEFTVTVENRMGKAVSQVMNLTALDNDSAGGFVRLSDTDPGAFALDSGAPFYPVGLNVCWSGDYEHYFRKMAAAGQNLVRVWICPWNLRMEKKNALGQYDLAEARRLDTILDLAAKYGIRVMLVLQYHGMLNNASWEENPYNRDNGGPCDFPSDYFTSAQARKMTKRFLRYAAARWGAYTSLMCWELFNEVDLADYYDPDAVLKWHREMADYLKKVDAHGHLVTSSAIYPGFYGKLWALQELDFNTAHVYSKMPGEEVLRRAVEASRFNKPFLIAEYGGGIKAAEDQKDPAGVRLHTALWSSFMSPAAGTAMPWWWDTHIEPNNLYGQFAGVARFAKDEDRRGRHWTVVRTMVDTPGGRRAGVQGLLDSAGGYLWIYDPQWTENPELPHARAYDEGMKVDVSGLLDGPYRVEIWPTAGTGEPDVRQLTADDGKLAVTLPAFSGDLAVKLKFKGQANPAVQTTAGRGE